MEDSFQEGLDRLKDMYNNLGYFDQYGGSVLLVVFIVLLGILVISFCQAMIRTQPIIDDWNNQRCSPTVMPIAGLIYPQDSLSATEFTQQNFTYCNQTILKDISGYALSPLTYLTNVLSATAKALTGEIQQTRGMFSKVRSLFGDVSQEIMGRLINFTIPLQQIIISFRDMMGKVQGTMVSSLYTLLGSYYTLQSLLGSIAQFIVIILIGLASMIAVFWAIPFLWGAASAATVTFIAISIPFIVMLAFMKDVLKVKTSFKIPRLKCFDKDTPIQLASGHIVPIHTLEVGNELSGNVHVTSIQKVATEGSIMYHLDDVIVSDTHLVQYDDKWIPVCQHPDAIKYADYKEPFLYCMNTSSKVIQVGSLIFSDWDEVCTEEDMMEIKDKAWTECSLDVNTLADFHRRLDGGFLKDCRVRMANGETKQIQEVEIGDNVEHGGKVYGTVRILSRSMPSPKMYADLGMIACGNVVLCDGEEGAKSVLVARKGGNKVLKREGEEYYHLLTERECLVVEGGHCFCDYNASIDLFLARHQRKLLSMKYV